MKLYTIGFTKKSARHFFEALCAADVKRIVDVRLNNVSQLAGFAKRDDLRYFADTICGMGYVQQPSLAPTKSILDAYKKNGGDWATYEKAFLALMQERKIEEHLSPELLDGGCLLCSEHKPHHCHRRLVAEYLQDKWGGIDIVHLE
jgi:uncharacterized protein (DUF488 family)